LALGLLSWHAKNKNWIIIIIIIIICIRADSVIGHILSQETQQLVVGIELSWLELTVVSWVLHNKTYDKNVCMDILLNPTSKDF
jgi:hypothetical protein